MAPVKKPKPILGKHYLKEWREAKGIGQQEAASAITLSRTMLSKIENGENPYQQQYVEGLAKLYERSPAELIGTNPSSAQGLDPATKLRSAMLAYGVHRDYLDQALRAIIGFVEDDDGDEKSESNRSQAQTALANSRPVKAQAE